MTQTPLISEEHIRSLASVQSFDRGFRYYRSNSVFDVARRGNLITARVEGSDYEPYRIQVVLDDTHRVIDASCTCPYDWGGICKHIVATLLATIYEPETVVAKPTYDVLLSDLSADQLRQIILGLVEAEPEFADALEREVIWLRDQTAIHAETTSSVVPVDINAVRREIHKDFRLAGKAEPFRHGYYDEYAEMEVDPYVILDPHLGKAAGLLDIGDVATALTLIVAILEAYIEGLTNLDEWIYEYNLDVFEDANMMLGTALAEVLLSQELQPDQVKIWLNKVVDWEEALGDLAITKTAVEQGWAYPPLVAAMQGEISEKGAWDGDAPDYADELAQVRLRILARQKRTQEYINLAEAEGQTGLAINMIARTGDIDKAISDARGYLVYPEQILSLALILEEKGETGAALNIAEYGLSLDQDRGKADLANWIREQATKRGMRPLALKAAQEVFAGTFVLADYLAVQQLAGEEWQTIQPQLLKKLQNSWSVTQKIDIYLHENMTAKAMQALDRENFVTDYDLLRVIEATRETHPDWGIHKCKQEAEQIMDAGKSAAYDSAVYWLGIARDIYMQHKRQREWDLYLSSLLETHARKYKLIPMLRNIGI
jgi:uncharacterized Zn finger protein